MKTLSARATPEMLGNSEMARRIRAFDWAPTPLGPIGSWSPRLLNALQTILSSRAQFVIYWGPELICLYNDAEIPTLSDWHPRALGTPASTLLAPMWDVVGPRLKRVLAGGDPTWAEDEPLLFYRNGRLEEAFFTYSYSAIRDERGRPRGVLLATHETTQRVLGEHHLRTLQIVASQAASVTSEVAICASAAEALVANPGLVFSQVYLFDGGYLRKAASAGIAVPGADDDAAPAGWPLLEVAAGSPSHTFELGQSKIAEMPRLGVAVPMTDVGPRPAVGVLVVGVADVRPIDDQQLGFLTLLGRQIAAALTAHRALAFAAATAEREQIERNLHDGAQQRLMAIQIKLGLLRDRIDDPVLGPALDEISGDAAAAIDDLRRLVHGIYPPVLRERGLADGLRAFAITAPIRIEVLEDGIGRYPAAVEGAVYFCALEAVQNAIKHAGPRARVTVRLNREGDELRFAVADDGPGFDPDERSEGIGLLTMRDRIAAVRGELTITSAPGRGTTIGGTVPV